jgi:hypothetical protein
LDQDIVILDIPNPDMVLPDGDAQRPDSSDMTHCFVHETWRHNEFKRQFPKATMTDFSQMMEVAPKFIKAEDLILAEYWTKETTDDVVLQFQSRSMLESEFNENWQNSGLGEPLSQRPTEVPRVKTYLTNGVEILERTDWPGKHIPFVSCFGKVIYVDTDAGSERQILSMTRLARDPYMLYCYYRTAQAELVGMTPKTPYIGYKGQFRTNAKEWAEVLTQPKAFLEAEPYAEDSGTGQVLPLPQRQAFDPPIERLEVGAEAARRAIMSAMGTSMLPSSAQRRNEKSGIALQEIKESAQLGAYHFVDHFDHMVRQVGVICEDLIDKVYDTAREVGVLSADDEASIVRINDDQMEPTEAQPKPISTKGTHRVTISTGPTSDSQREEVSRFVDTLAGSKDAEMVRVIMPMLVKMKNLGPLGDKLAELLKFLQPPEVREVDQGEQPDPRELMAKLQEADQMLQAAKAEIDELRQAEATDQVKEQAKTERDVALAEIEGKLEEFITTLKGDQAERLAQIKGELAIELQQVKGSQDMAEQDDQQKHEVAMAAAEGDQARQAEDRADDRAVRDTAVGLGEDEAVRGDAAREAEKGRRFQAGESKADRAQKAAEVRRGTQKPQPDGTGTP